jgi:hypothetical protein
MARGKIRLELNDAGIREVLKWPSTHDLVGEYGNQLANRAGNNAPADADFSVQVFTGRDRARAHVATANIPAMIAEAQNRALLRALGGGSGR